MIEKKILVVDDDFIIRENIKMILQRRGFKIEEADNGKEALENVKTFKPDLMLLDYEMPVMNGFEVYSHLRNSKATFNLPIIICSGRADIVGQIMSISNNKVDFNIKPFNVERLKNTVASFI